MNLEELPEKVRKDVENQSLAILETIIDDIIVIGGWAVRAHAGKRHNRYTLDIDGVTAEDKMSEAGKKLRGLGLKSEDMDWGVRFSCEYEPEVQIIDEEIRRIANEVELRIDISGPRIVEMETPHYYEFDLSEYSRREILYHDSDSKIVVRVPPVESLAAVKLGLPVDYKNNFDSAVLLAMCDVDEVIGNIRNNDDWHEMVIRRIPKLKGRMKDPGRLENELCVDGGMDISEYIRKLEYIAQLIS
ncbi:MAG: hypothetical protein E3J35_02760 [Methanomassiliicoccales archaeon]|nr:MAG: hypothetical protein E3J35_02760 [Methanomassiliicoccales archaeon]